jgi:hypothetical protein
MIGGRVGRNEWFKIGVPLNEAVPLGAFLLLRAKFWNGIPYLFIQDWKRIDG